jgi:hypothetical protein
MTVRRSIRTRLALTAATAAGVVAATVAGAAQALPPHVVDPATLARGANPSVPYMVRNTIHDGDLTVRSYAAGRPLDLWSTARGYVVRTWYQRQREFVIAFVDQAGTGLIGSSRGDAGVAVSPDGRRMAWGKGTNELRTPTVVRVTNPNTGRVLARHSFPWATVLAVTEHRVLLTRLSARTPKTTWWWNYETDTLRKLSDRGALRADVTHDRVVFESGPPDSFCNRVAPLSHPRRTLWRSCALAPHDWSPSGRRVLATFTYFDDAGTARWVTFADPSTKRLGRIDGRFGWDGVFEDDTHFLVVAENAKGQAAIVRCTLAARCERASRIWEMGPVDYQPNYVAPPVVLPNN